VYCSKIESAGSKCSIGVNATSQSKVQFAAGVLISPAVNW
jgi:hypothetical protein